MKNKKENNKGLWIFNQFLIQPSFTSTDKKVSSFIYYLKKNDIDTGISINKVSKALHLPQSTTDDSFKNLTKLGYIKKENGKWVATHEEIYNSTNYLYIDESMVDINLNTNRFNLLLDIVSFTNKTGQYFKKNKTIAKEMGISISTVTRIITYLNENGLISTTYDGLKRILTPITDVIMNFDRKVIGLPKKKKIVQPEALKEVKVIQPIIKEERKNTESIIKTNQRRIPRYDLPIGFNVHTFLRNNNLDIDNETYEFLLGLGNIENYLMSGKIAVVDDTLVDGTILPENLTLHEEVFNIMD